MQTKQSYQTKADSGFFAYNPFTGADIDFFPVNRANAETTREQKRIFILTALPIFDCAPDLNAPYHNADGKLCYRRTRQATACNGRVLVTLDNARNIIVTVNGKQTERYSIRYPSKRKKHLFAAY